MLEYRKAMRAIAHGFDTGEWPAPITEDYARRAHDFDVRRLERCAYRLKGNNDVQYNDSTDNQTQKIDNISI
ncbi:Uncharacterised protein [Raoultella terrigena]|uniref:Uncharacterized protein n=1 Tax=Raoultella terrigena TaxID=577 RepID=A0A4U9CUK6_RAOTE|nr:Uncharacterised protein [Raoultella terrigena]